MPIKMDDLIEASDRVDLMLNNEKSGFTVPTSSNCPSLVSLGVSTIDSVARFRIIKWSYQVSCKEGSCLRERIRSARVRNN